MGRRDSWKAVVRDRGCMITWEKGARSWTKKEQRAKEMSGRGRRRSQHGEFRKGVLSKV